MAITIRRRSIESASAPPTNAVSQQRHQFHHPEQADRERSCVSWYIW